jgi:hypothetical protein
MNDKVKIWHVPESVTFSMQVVMSITLTSEVTRASYHAYTMTSECGDCGYTMELVVEDTLLRNFVCHPGPDPWVQMIFLWIDQRIPKAANSHGAGP